MEFENDATNAGDAVGSLPTANAPAAPPIPTSPSGPQPDTAQPPALPVSPAAPSRSFMAALAHSLIGSTMAVAAQGVKKLAGPAPVDSYSTDDSGKMTPKFRPDNTASRLERLALHAMEGLAAGSRVPPGAWGEGLGAGVSAVRQQAQQQDMQKRKEAA